MDSLLKWMMRISQNRKECEQEQLIKRRKMKDENEKIKNHKTSNLMESCNGVIIVKAVHSKEVDSLYFNSQKISNSFSFYQIIW